jgi:long-subunit fatty acid transport protein
MKKIYLFIISAFVSGQLLAGGILTNTNQSAQFVRMLSRNASVGLDAAYFNPAGLIKMDDGFYLAFHNQTIIQDKTVTTTFPLLNNKEYVGDVFAPLFPSFFATYKKDKFAVSLSFGPNAGGGSAEYKTGLPSFEMPISMLPTSLTTAGIPTDKYSADVYFDGSSVFWGTQLNASYKINDMISVAAGVRMINAKNTYQGHIKNIMINPMHPLNPNGSGQMVLASQFFTAVATASYGAAQSVQPLIDNGVPDLETALAADAITQEQYNQLTGGLGGNYQSGMPITTVQAMYNGTGDLMTANAESTSDMEVDATQTGLAFTPILSANLSFLDDKLNVAIKYEFNTKLELTNSADSDKDANGMFKNDSTFRNDIPAILSLGIGYSFADNLRASISWNHYFDKNADWNGKEKFIDNNLYEIAVGLEYDINEMFTVSAGYMHGQTGVGQGYQTDISFSNSTNTIGLGGRWNINEHFSVDLGALFVSYTTAEEDKTYLNIPYKETYDKSLMDFAIGLNYKF